MTEPFEPLPPLAEPPKEPDKPKRLSFREANLGPEPKLAESKLPETPRPPGFFKTRKRTVAITLLAVGTGTAAIYGLTQLDSSCGQNSADQWTTGQATPCTHGGGWHSSYFFGSNGGSSTANASTTSRGGFGSTGSAHGGGGE